MSTKTVKRRPPGRTAGAGVRGRIEPEVLRYTLEPLNPWLICGPDTTVTELWKARERNGAATVFHLVYLDRYGWYCEHGRNCPAVPEVRRAARELTELVNRGRRAVTRGRKRGR